MSENITPAPAPTAASAEEKQWAMFAHLSSLVAMWAGYMGFLGPLIIWLIKKEQLPFVNDQGKEALNFQLNMFGWGLALAMGSIPVIFLTLGFGMLLVVPLALGLVAYSVIMPVLAAVKAN